MPFERYFRPDEAANHTTYSYYYDPRHTLEDDCHYPPGSYLAEDLSDRYDSNAPRFQIPQYVLNGPPIVAPGGGAEILPPGLLDSGSRPSSRAVSSSWFTNAGFTSHVASSSSRPDNANTTAGSPALPLNEPQRLPHIIPPAPLPEPTLRDTASTYTPIHPSSASTGSSNTASHSLSSVFVPDPLPPLPVTPPSTVPLSAYSPSGFDVLSILSRVVNRLNPTVQLGPVDLSCSFVIVDVRRYDSPIVYASPTFCHLTGYSEQEVLGRNCRFLQSPTGNVAKGECRRFASSEAVSLMRRLLASSKECQTTLINYRKGGQAFINLVTVIPLRGGVHNTPEEADQVAYHIGFQMDLTEQPNRMPDTLRDASYLSAFWRTSSVSSSAMLPSVSHSLGQSQNVTNVGTKGGRHGQMMSMAVSKELRCLLADKKFTDSVLISTGTNMSGPTSVSGGSSEQPGSAKVPLTMFVTPPPSSTSTNRTGGNTIATSDLASVSPALSLLLLEYLPDFVLVLSLKGAFLYVAPSVRLVLGYEPEDLVGKSISDICHPADLVPLMRELKEGSVSGLSLTGANDIGSSTAASLVPKPVDLLFRALPKVRTSSSSSQIHVSSEKGAFRSSQSSSPSVSQFSASSGTLSSDDSCDGTVPPYIWLECRGRLHVEPGKGRKAIILSGRSRWMPLVRWNTINKAGGIGGGMHSSCMTTGSRLSAPSPGEAAGAPLIDLQEFWAMLSPQGTFMVASTSVRDILGWGSGEMIGRNIWSMVKDSRTGLRERVEAELSKLDPPEASMVDPPPTIVSTLLVHRDFHVVPMRLAFYRTPRSRNHAPPTTSSIGAVPTPLIHPINNPLCPIVCQATVASHTEYQSSDLLVAGFDPIGGYGSSKGKARDGNGESSIHRPSGSLFEGLEASHGTSWQYEIQQLKFANQRLREEISSLEAGIVTSPDSSCNTIGPGPVASDRFGPESTIPSSTAPLSTSQSQMPLSQLYYMPSTLPTLTPARPLNTLHEHDPPSSEWSSLTGANGLVTIPRKRPRGVRDGPT